MKERKRANESVLCVCVRDRESERKRVRGRDKCEGVDDASEGRKRTEKQLSFHH